MDYLIISVGGGGLISGVSSYIKQLSPNTKVIGVEPEGAKGMTDSIKLGKPLENVSVNAGPGPSSGQYNLIPVKPPPTVKTSPSYLYKSIVRYVPKEIDEAFCMS